MQFTTSSIITAALLASGALADQTLHTFGLMGLRTGTPIQFSTIAVNNNNELVIDKTFQPFVGDWYDDHTVQFHNTSLWLTVGSDNKLVVGSDSHKWNVNDVPTEQGSAFQGYLVSDSTKGYYAVPYGNNKGYQVYTNYTPKNGDGSIPFALTPVWKNYTVPSPPKNTDVPHSSPISTVTKNIKTAYTTITEYASPVIKTITVGGVHSFSTVTTKAPATVTVTCTVTETVSNCK